MISENKVNAFCDLLEALENELERKDNAEERKSVDLVLTDEYFTDISNVPKIQKDSEAFFMDLTNEEAREIFSLYELGKGYYLDKSKTPEKLYQMILNDSPSLSDDNAIMFIDLISKNNASYYIKEGIMLLK